MQSESSRKGRLVSSVLSSAIRLWLQSQLEGIDRLDIRIRAGNRQILSGDLPEVSIAASNAVYRGLHLSQMHLSATQIRLNVARVLRGHPLRLLKPIPVATELIWEQTDLNASARSPLLIEALNQFLLPWLQQASGMVSPIILDRAGVEIETDGIVVRAESIRAETNQRIDLIVRSGLRLSGDRYLEFVDPAIELSDLPPIRPSDSFRLDLGSDTSLETLTLLPGRLVCRGRLTVRSD